ncbi:GHKL domain-containing protein [Ginsengibacter hankyongi]|uniref:histidine kinase n=1 Tax=Ginsengibacter hankyongi TaxID=2607284 RepID=A0A5J5IL18_9BACT|nr:ATP-binding protein [Ginsengibacter hankyongi]KAA9041063.1 GHKL domain-containing protein [Ginsengibacter hankyongi]
MNSIFNKNTNTFFGRNGYLLLASAWLFTISFIIDNYWSGTSTINAVQRRIQRNINKNQRRSDDFFNNTALINKVINRSYSEKEINDFVNKDYFIFIYKITPFAEPQPVFWNTQVILPDSTVLDKPDGRYFKRLVNGWYVINKKSYENSNGLLYEIVSLIPVKWNYYIVNKYLINSFIAVDNIQDAYDVSLVPTNIAIKDINGNKLFYLKQIKYNVITRDNIISILLRILAGILVLFFIQKFARFYYERKGFWPAFSVLIISIIILRTLSYFLPIPLNFKQLELFSSDVYGSNIVFHSLGDLLINSLLFIWVVLFIRVHYQFKYVDSYFDTKLKKYGVIGIISLLMIVITISCGNIVRSLVSDSQISFDVINFFTLNIYSVVGFIVLSCVATGYFFLIQILMYPIKRIIENHWFILYVFIAVIGLVFLTVMFHSTSVAFNLSLLAWLLFFIYLLNKVSLAIDTYNLISSRFIFWLFFFSVSITAAIVIQNRKKELEQRKHFAENIANRADPAGERIISIILSDFNNEALLGIFNRFKKPNENRFLKDSLINENFSGYLNKYDTRIYTFDSSEAPLYNLDSTNFNSLNAIIQTQGKKTEIPDLYYYDISYDRFNYISKKEIVDTTGKKKGYIFIVSTPKKYKSDALYPELFSKGSTNSIESSSVYAFAIYNDNQLSSSNNDYPFPTMIDPGAFTYNEFKIVNRNGYEELWYKANEDKVIVIARQDDFFIESITLFAYLFCSFLVITVLFNFLNKILGSKIKSENFRSFWQFTIRNQVHGTIIMISIFSFLVIGITTILFFISRYHSNNREKLSRTIHVMENEIRNSIDTMSTAETQMMDFDSVSNEKLDETINRVAGIHAADINLYDINGDLKVSSLPLPYKKGIVSEKMDPVAFYHLNKLKDVQYSQEQLIGSLEYLSNYVPVRDETGREYAYLNIPYFESQSNLQDEISNFLVTIINLNAFIFLIAGIIALFITNRITRSFSLISNKMKEINLEKTNEEIIWTRKDEIGELVNEYNKMVRKLDVSAQLLAKSEREGAWREMARQVAHEIKNPLTPMKLNLQYLQMAIDNNSPGVKKISLYVSNILLEQIEHLSKIASDFAQFANLGNSKNQLFDINRTLISIASLYSANEKLKINTNLYDDEILVEADKTQINRLFTNLLQNAVQSVPETRKAIIEIESHLSGDHVIVSIKDNGNGIPPEMYSKIFIPNFTTKTSGTGLGLAMCKGIVEKLNGKIWFETKEGSWTIFFVELPVVNS